MSTLHTIDATETINRIIDFFPLHQQKQVRIMLAGTLKGIISQRLLPRAGGSGRIPAIEILIATNRIRDFILDPTQSHLITRCDQGGRLLRDADVRPGATQALRGGPHHPRATPAGVAANPHDFKLLVQSQGHDVSLMTF